MKQLEFREKQFYDYSQTYLSNRILSIKNEFIKKCKNNQSLSKEYISYISNPDNIKVTLKPDYGVDLFLELYSLKVKITYSYTFSYVSSTTVSIEEGWDGKLRAQKVSDNYRDCDSSFTCERTFFSSPMNPCKMRVGNAKNYNINSSQYVHINKASSIPADLAKLVNKTWTEQDIAPFVKEATVPDNVKQKFHDEVMRHDSSARNFYYSVADFSVEDADLIILPIACPFDISVTFDDVQYEQKNVNEISEITATGEESQHHKEFVDATNRLLKLYDPKKWVGNKLVNISLLIGFSFCAILVILLVFCEKLGLPNLRQEYFKHFIIMIVISFISMLVGPGGTTEVKLPTDNEDLYSPSLPISTLKNKVENRLADKESRNTKNLTIRFVIFIILMIGLIIATITFCSASKKDQSVSKTTPSIVNVYGFDPGYYNDYIREFNVLSCDASGNITASFKAINGLYYLEYTCTGKIIEKDKHSCEVEFQIDEILHNTTRKTPDSTFIGHFAFNGDSATINGKVYDKGKRMLDTNLKYNGAVGKYKYNTGHFYLDYHYAEITSWDSNGNVEALFYYKTEYQSYQISFSGKVICKRGNDAFIYFDSSTVIDGSNPEICSIKDAPLYARLYENSGMGWFGFDTGRYNYGYVYQYFYKVD